MEGSSIIHAIMDSFLISLNRLVVEGMYNTDLSKYLLYIDSFLIIYFIGEDFNVEKPTATSLARDNDNPIIMQNILTSIIFGEKKSISDQVVSLIV